ncbi:MAG: hypothetical protein ACRDFY_08810 [Candidatus Limnocylindria bacterium]
MRSAAFLSAAIVAIGAYLMVAASLAISPAWVAVGVVAIAGSMSVALVAVEQRAAGSRHIA